MSAPLLLVMAAPSGAGKTTVLRALLERDPRLVFSVSHTTRKPIRKGEREGVDYHFVTREEFEAMSSAGEFLEWAEYAGNLYGTHRASVEQELAAGRDVVLEVEVQGAAQVKERRSDARLLFLLPPDLETLEQRLRGRGTDADEVIERRLEIARREIASAGIFHYAVVNERVEEAVDQLVFLIEALREGREATLRDRFGADRVLERWHRSTDPS